MENNKITLAIFLIIVLVLLLFPFGGMIGGFGYGYGGMMNMMYNYGFGGTWIFGWLFMAGLIVALVLFIVWLIQQIQKTERRKR